MTPLRCSCLLIALTCCLLPGADPILIDGSSTVYPITAAMADLHRASHPGLEISVAF